ncbi:hypothetical protein MJO28_003736 [Puccinia striiformis f. sp. tritici]|uniref:Uncharacterized protein n=5 Tax=Puccinia striiformis TaxID=27350 RepID=A0A0L0URY8_9BASI|nr:hypothetical protein Pst134EB_008751 [Puccinia striiformis f. sp. tritici]KNE89745.1 hypothetical protein PSTG_16780 [Puccinia striiformis f. sp. tritici PST-78]POW06569.1 hypothetical protein PSHT_10285 [Puccinia striiformis]KAI7956641.1 hypothetical protein MJO28_003736 [Puccinia striiformis f. sp. tritici]KAI7964173.1 hypothetical protein MJO29_004600 [Puccinia striiformis f. sp. tritici]
MKLLSILAGLPLFYSILWGPTPVQAAEITLPDLNELPEESPVEELQLATHRPTLGAPFDPISTESSETSNGKRKWEHEQPGSSVTSERRTRLLQAQAASTSNSLSDAAAEDQDMTAWNNWVARRAIMRIITAMNDKEANIRIHDDLNLIQPSGHNSPQVFQRPKTAKDLRRLYVIKSGQVVEDLIKVYFDDFRSKTGSKEYRARHPLISTHKSVPFALANRIGDKPGGVFRVLVADISGFKHMQTHAELNSLYKTLATSLYEEHRIILQSLRIPPFGIRIMQMNLLDWLKKEIFSPDNSHPLIGILDPKKYPEWNPNSKRFPGKVGKTQAKLIRYFSQISESAKADKIVFHLLESYKGQHMVDYLALSTLSKSIREDPKEIERRLKLEPEVALMSKLTKNKAIANLRNVKITENHPDHDLLSDSCEIFNARYPETKLSRIDRRRYHPNLSLAMYIEDTPRNGNHPLRVIKSTFDESENEGPCMLSAQEVGKKFKKLARTVDYTHKLILAVLKIIQPDYDSNREEALAELIDTILGPKSGLPIVGDIKANNGIPPWEDIAHASSPLFSDTQINIINFMSAPSDTGDVKRASDFFLTSWYQDKYPDQLERLLEALKKQ